MVPFRSTEGGGQECLYILHPEEPESQAQLTPSPGQDSDHNMAQSDGSVRLGQQAEVHQENRVTVEECDSQGQEGVAWVRSLSFIGEVPGRIPRTKLICQLNDSDVGSCQAPGGGPLKFWETLPGHWISNYLFNQKEFTLK